MNNSSNEIISTAASTKITTTTTTIIENEENFKDNSVVDGKRLCGSSKKICSKRPMEGYKYCIKHILEDPLAPFRQCEFISLKSQKQCTNPVSIKEDDPRFCVSHKTIIETTKKRIKEMAENEEAFNTDESPKTKILKILDRHGLSVGKFHQEYKKTLKDREREHQLNQSKIEFERLENEKIQLFKQKNQEDKINQLKLKLKQLNHHQDNNNNNNSIDNDISNNSNNGNNNNQQKQQQQQQQQQVHQQEESQQVKQELSLIIQDSSIENNSNIDSNIDSNIKVSSNLESSMTNNSTITSPNATNTVTTTSNSNSNNNNEEIINSDEENNYELFRAVEDGGLSQLCDEFDPDFYFATSFLLTDEEIIQRKKIYISKLILLYKKQYNRFKERLRILRRHYITSATKSSSTTSDNNSDNNNNNINNSDNNSISNNNINELFKKQENIQNQLNYLQQQQQQLNNQNLEQKNCIYDGCRIKSILLSDYCFSHILFDKNQRLFSECTYQMPNGKKCRYPILKIQLPTLCREHLDIYETNNDIIKSLPKKQKQFIKQRVEVEKHFTPTFVSWNSSSNQVYSQNLQQQQQQQHLIQHQQFNHNQYQQQLYQQPISSIENQPQLQQPVIQQQIQQQLDQILNGSLNN